MNSIRIRRGANLAAPLIGVAVVAFAVIVAIMSASERQEVVDRPLADVQLLSGPLDPLTQSSGDSIAGRDSAPLATVRTLDGEQITIGAPGQAQLLVFLAHWCPACDRELDTLRQLPGTTIPDDVQVIAILTAEDQLAPNWPAERWFTGRVPRMIAARDSADSELYSTYGLSQFPAWVAIDADGIVRQRVHGLLGLDDVAQLAQLASRR